LCTEYKLKIAKLTYRLIIQGKRLQFGELARIVGVNLAIAVEEQEFGGAVLNGAAENRRNY
jgi:hypothetical protein